MRIDKGELTVLKILRIGILRIGKGELAVLKILRIGILRIGLEIYISILIPLLDISFLRGKKKGENWTLL